MTPSTKSSTILNTLINVYWFKIAVWTLIYFTLARLGFLIPFSGELATLVWPASGIILAVLIITDFELWPVVPLGALILAIYNQHSIPLTVGVVAAHSAEILIGAYLLTSQQSFNKQLRSLSSLWNFVLYAAVLGPAIGATLGVLSFAVSPEGQNMVLTDLWWHWWVGHSISMLALSPALLTTYPNFEIKGDRWQILEASFVIICLVTIGILVFGRLSPAARNYPLGHVLFPFLLWLALRFSPRNVSIVGSIVCAIAVLGTVYNIGPFSRLDLNTNLLLLYSFVISVVVASQIAAIITEERRQVQSVLAHSNDLLEQRVADRTADLSTANERLLAEIDERKLIEAQLLEARDQAIEALELKTQILANVSHDARTPLNIITMLTELMQIEKYGELTDKQQKTLSIILSNAHELLGFINNLLDQAHLQSASTHTDTADLDVWGWFEERQVSLNTVANNWPADLRFEIASDFPQTIKTDRTSLNKILVNLVHNSLKFTPEGEVAVMLKPHDVTSWKLSVADTGIGMNPESTDHIFEPFWQVDGSETRFENRGVGLGLSIVQQRVHLLGGHISVKSEFGQGTTIDIIFPYDNH